MSHGTPSLSCFFRLKEFLLSVPTHIVVTGSGGWLGKATLELLDDVFGEKIAEHVSAYARMGRQHCLRSGRSIQLQPLQNLASLKKVYDKLVVVHYAFLTREKIATVSLEEYIASNRALTSFVIEQSGRLQVEGLFITSSGAVYRSDRGLEFDLVANPYGMLKLEEEQIFTKFIERRNARLAICRVFNLAGPFINKSYALSDFLISFRERHSIEITAKYPVIRSYSHIQDVVTVGLACATGLIPCPQEPYDTAGEVQVEIGELAQRIIYLLGDRNTILNRNVFFDNQNEANIYVGNGLRYFELLKSLDMGGLDLDRQIIDTDRFLRIG